MHVQMAFQAVSAQAGQGEEGHCGPKKAAAAELEDAAVEMGEVAAAMKQAAVHMNAASPDRPRRPPGSGKGRRRPVEQAAKALPRRNHPPGHEVRRDKARAIEELPAKDRQRLRALAEKMMLGTEPAPPTGGAPRRKPH